MRSVRAGLALSMTRGRDCHVDAATEIAGRDPLVLAIAGGEAEGLGVDDGQGVARVWDQSVARRVVQLLHRSRARG